MKRAVWLLFAGLAAAGCLMSRLEVGPAEDAGGSGEGNEGGASSGKGGKNGAGGTEEPSGGAGGVAGSGSMMGGAGGVNDSGGAGHPNTGEGGSGAGGEDGEDGGVGGGGAGGGRSITDVWPSTGCGNESPATGKLTIGTSGVKDASCNAKLADATPRCGPWGQPSSTWSTTPIPREYYVNLPADYDASKPYSLIFLGPGCGGTGAQIYSLDNNVDGQAIRVGLTPPPVLVGHGYAPSSGCFDDAEGDDSVDFAFYETLYDVLDADLCFDRNRVFVGGNSSGASIANQLGCKYAGDDERPIRGVLANTGGLTTTPGYRPTCGSAPMAGMWVHEVNDPETPFSGTKEAIRRAMAVNGCTIGDSYDTASFEDYPIGGGQADTTCKLILGCPAEYPLVVCPLPGNGHGSHDAQASPGFSTFVKSLMP